MANLRMFCEAYVCRSVWISITHISHKYVEDRAYYMYTDQSLIRQQRKYKILSNFKLRKSKCTDSTGSLLYVIFQMIYALNCQSDVVF